MTGLLVLVLTAISMILPASAGAQNITPVSIKLDPGGTVTVPLQSPGLNMVTGAVVTAGDGSPVGDVTARVVHQSPTSLSVIVTAAPTARPRPDYQVWLQTSASKTPIRIAIVQVIARAAAPGGPAYQAERQMIPREDLKMQRGQPTPPPPPTLESLTPATPTVIGGQPLNVEVRLTGPVSTPAVVGLQYAANFSGVSMPQSVTVPAGQASASFQVTAGSNYSESLNLGLRALYGGVQKDATVTVLPGTVQVLRVTLDAPSVPGGQRLRGQVVLNTPARQATTVTLSVTQSGTVGITPSAQVPASVTIPIGQTSVPFDITTVPVFSQAQLGLFAAYGGSRQGAIFTVDPVAVAIASLTLSAPETLTNSQVVATLGLDRPAPIDVPVTLAFADLPIVDSNWRIPATVTVAAGQLTATVPIAIGGMLVADKTVRVSATVGASTKSGSLVVRRIDVSSLTFTPSTAIGGQSVTGTVTLTRPARPGGVNVSLSWSSGDSNSTTQLAIPQSVTVPAGQTSASVQFPTPPIAPVDRRNAYTMGSDLINVRAGVEGVEKGDHFIVTWPKLQSFTLTPPSVLVGGSTQATVTLASPAGPSGYLVRLTYTGYQTFRGVVIVDLPQTVTVPAGQSSVTLPVSTTFRWGEGFPLRLVMTAQGSQALDIPKPSASLEITAPEVSAVSVSPQQVAAGQSATATVQLGASAPAGGAIVNVQVYPTGGSPNASAPQQFTIPAGQTSGTFIITTMPASSGSSSGRVDIIVRAAAIGQALSTPFSITNP